MREILRILLLLIAVGATVNFVIVFRRSCERMSQLDNYKPSPEQSRAYAEKFAREHPVQDNRPKFTDYNLAPPATMQRLEGQWEIIQHWEGRWCKISKDRDRRRREYDRQLVGINDFLMIRTNHRVWDGRVNIQVQAHIAFDPLGSGTFISAGYSPWKDIADDTDWAIANAARCFSDKNNDRGIYRFDGNRLLLYWVNLSKEGKALPTPTEIPKFPLPTGAELLVLQRIDSAEPYPPPEADLAMAREKSLRIEAFWREHDQDQPTLIDQDHPVPRSLESPDGFEWVVSDPQDLPEPLYRLYEERYGQP